MDQYVVWRSIKVSSVETQRLGYKTKLGLSPVLTENNTHNSTHNYSVNNSQLTTQHTIIVSTTHNSQLNTQL